MTNANKAKGDKGERDAVAVLLELAGDLATYVKPKRVLGAGRQEDSGDVRVFHDTAIQVKNSKSPAAHIRVAAEGARVQQKHKSDLDGHAVPFHLGMVKIPNASASRGQLVWMACVMEYPDPDVIPVFAPDMPTAIKMVRLNPTFLFAVAGKPSQEPVLITGLETWLADYRHFRS